MLKKLLLLAFFIATPALAQNVQQSGTVTRNHLPYWVTSGVIGDGGSSADSPISSIGVTNNGGAGICVSSDRQTAAGRNQLCFGAQTNGAAFISLQNYGTAAAQNLQFIINGITTIPAFVSGSPVPGNLVSSVGGQALQDSGVAAANGIITSGTWQGTSIAIGFGGSGASTAAAARSNYGLGTMATQNSTGVAITGGTITGLPTPANPTDVAIKSYVDATASGLNILAQSALATATVLPNSPTYANGASGVGATLTAGSNTTLTVDGVVAVINTVVLVKNQAAPAQNGIYTVTTAGSGGAAWVLTRATYFDQAAEMKVGSYTFITSGSTNTNSSWTLAATIVTVGTDAVNWNQFSSTGAVVSSLNVQTGALVQWTLPQGRLTLVSGVPVMTTSQAAATTVYYTSYAGKNVPIYNGTAVAMYQLCAANTVGACEVSSALGSNWTTNSNYDWFLALDNGTLRLCSGPAWTSDTARGSGAGTTQLAQIDGINSNAVSITCRYNNTTTIAVSVNQGTYVGSTRIGTAGQTNFIYGAAAANGTPATIGICNAYNRVSQQTTVSDTTSSWTYNVGNVWRAPNGNTNTMRVTAMRCLNEDSITGTYYAAGTPPASGTNMGAGVGVDSTTAFCGTTMITFTLTGAVPLVAQCAATPGIGVHFVSALEFNNNTGVSTWYGSLGTAYLQTGLQVNFTY
jgi:hypothetical protein